MNHVFEEGGRRFLDVARELKSAASEVQQSIELAREEMKRGILELPGETEASAATMRRAVAEQIKALAELNEIVARQGQALDVAAHPPARCPRATAPRSSRRPAGGDHPRAGRAGAREVPAREAYGPAVPVPQGPSIPVR